MDFIRLERELLHLLCSVKRKKQQFDSACSACHTLFRSWPKRSVEKEETEDGRQGDVSKNACGDPLDPREQAEVQFVNSVLSKAARTRKKLSSKVSEIAKETSSMVDQDVVGQEQQCDSIPRSQLWEVCEEGSGDTSARHETTRLKPVVAKSKDENDFKSDSASDLEGDRSNPKNKSVSGPDRSKVHPVGESEVGVSKQNVLKSSNTVPGKQKASASNSKTGKWGIVAEEQRPASSSSTRSSKIIDVRPNSSRGRVKPAHVTAPFKTQPNLPVPKRQTKKPMISAAQDRHKKNCARLNLNRGQSKVLPPIHANSKDHTCETDALYPTAQVAIDNDCDSLGTFETENHACEESRLCPTETREQEITVAVSELTLVNKAEAAKTAALDQPSTSKSDTTAQDSKQSVDRGFCLLTQGPSLNIPPKLRRAYTKNQQLRHKLQQKMSQKGSSTSGKKTGALFIEKLEEMFDCEPELEYRHQAWRCLGAHNRLAEAMAKLSLHELTELSSPEEVLHAKVMVEFVLSSFSAQSEEAELLSKNPDPTICNASKLTYSSVQQLHQFVNAQLSVQTLKCQLQLIQIILSSLLSSLETGKLKGDDALAFRGLFALATSSGEHSPAFIHSM